MLPDKQKMVSAAVAHAAAVLKRSLAARQNVILIAATGVSQLAFLEQLIHNYTLEWARIEVFHLDEYVGLGIDHPASFARYIRDKLVLPAGVQHYHLLDGLGDTTLSLAQINDALRGRHVDLALVGIGENAHLAFNDPPADFDTEDPYLLVHLDQACRLQQVGEGWFAGLEEVPKTALSMSIKQILKSDEIICIASDLRKSKAVAATIEGPVTPWVPASILQTHPRATMFIDPAAGSLLKHTLSPSASKA